jgi:serine/threonine protein kinase/tetratricopeptide (TPR) repeat protein
MNREHLYEQAFASTAVQLRFVTREQLAAAVGPSSASAPAAVSQLLRAQGLISEDEAAAIAAIVRQQLARQAEGTAVTDPAATQADRPAALSAPAAASPFATSADAAAGAEVREDWSRFTVLRPHAQGGLGRVQVARDRQINREIALKEILPPHADNETSRQRFVREAEITGALEHPGVVPVYSLGEYPDGRPFYAMRLIVGQNLRNAIAEFHGQDKRTVGSDVRSRQLLGQFVDACQAIHYAHNRGVVHRDVKPENIMLGDFGETLVVDWGLARPYDATPDARDSHRPVSPSASASSTQTVDGQIVGTPAYMSPEQAAGRLDLLGPTVDVYSLGATLYHLLTGQAPFVGELNDLIPLVQTGRFPPPRQLNRGIPRPLESICLRAMAVQPRDRYPSARDLALDVERYLADDKVDAYEEPLAVRAWRWSRNHRTAVFSMIAATTVALAGLSLGVVLLGAANKRERLAKDEATANFVEAVKQRQRAEENFQQAQDAVKEYYVRVSEETLLTQPGMQPLRNELLRQALDYYERFLQQRADDSTLRAESAQAALFAGQIAEEISSPESAVPYYLQSISHYEQLPSDQPTAAELARVVNALGGAYQKLNQFDQAREAYAKARRLREQLSRQHPEDAEAARELSNTFMNLGSLALTENNLAEGLELMRQAQAIRRAHVRGPSPSLKLRRDLAMGYFNLAAAQLTTGDVSDARRNLLDAESAFDQLRQIEPAEFKHERRLALTRRLLGDLAAAAGNAAQAQGYYQQAREALGRLAADNPRVQELSVDLAGVLMNLGALHAERSESAAALAELAAATELLEQLVAGDDSVPRYRRDLGATRRALGQALHATNQADEARRELESSRELFQELVRQFPANRDYAAQLEATKATLQEVAEPADAEPAAPAP